jgi:hypothetical protein
MAGNGDDSGRADGQKVKGGIRSMFTKPKNKPTKTSEQSALSHRFNKLSTNQKKVDKAGTPRCSVNFRPRPTCHEQQRFVPT